MAIYDPYMVIYDHIWTMLYDHIWAIYGHIRAIYGHIWSYMVYMDLIWPFVFIYGLYMDHKLSNMIDAWPYMAMYIHIWLSLAHI